MEARKWDLALEFLEEETMERNGKSRKTYTVEDIQALPDGVRAELLDGEMFMMATPTIRHQLIIGWMYLEVANYIRDKKGKCRTVLSPFGVYLMNDDKNYVEPDLLVVCDRGKLENDGVHGAVDWAVEIVSPSSRTMDYKRKLAAYEKAGVREYWIIDPKKELVTVYNLAAGWKPIEYTFRDRVPSGIVEGLEMDFTGLAEELEGM